MEDPSLQGFDTYRDSYRSSEPHRGIYRSSDRHRNNYRSHKWYLSPVFIDIYRICGASVHYVIDFYRICGQSPWLPVRSSIVRTMVTGACCQQWPVTTSTEVPPRHRVLTDEENVNRNLMKLSTSQDMLTQSKILELDATQHDLNIVALL